MKIIAKTTPAKSSFAKIDATINITTGKIAKSEPAIVPIIPEICASVFVFINVSFKL